MLHKPIKKAWLLYVCLLTLFAGCSKCNKTISPNDASSLPPATQVGAYTFGCMLNGQPWTPVGRQSILVAANPSANYEPDYRGGAFSVSADIYSSQPVRLKEYISVGGIGINRVGEYNLSNSSILFQYADVAQGISYYSDEDIASNCKLVITKLDLTNKIIAGTFSFTLEKKDTGKKVTVTDGRFDMKFL